MSFSSYAEYVQLVFHLLSNRAAVASHTVAVYTVNCTVGITRGEVVFPSGHILRVFEQIDFVAHRIVKYSYELALGDDALWWCDSMPHPQVPELQSSHPHHKHIPPEIKHHRIPAPEMSFERPNLPGLLTQVEQIISSE